MNLVIFSDWTAHHRWLVQGIICGSRKFKNLMNLSVTAGSVKENQLCWEGKTFLVLAGSGVIILRETCRMKWFWRHITVLSSDLVYLPDGTVHGLRTIRKYTIWWFYLFLQFLAEKWGHFGDLKNLNKNGWKSKTSHEHSELLMGFR